MAGFEMRYQSLEEAQNGVERHFQPATSENARLDLEPRSLIERNNERYDQYRSMSAQFQRLRIELRNSNDEKSRMPSDIGTLRAQLECSIGKIQFQNTEQELTQEKLNQRSEKNSALLSNERSTQKSECQRRNPDSDEHRGRENIQQASFIQ
jgi:hypothetical protein